ERLLNDKTFPATAGSFHGNRYRPVAPAATQRQKYEFCGTFFARDPAALQIMNEDIENAGCGGDVAGGVACCCDLFRGRLCVFWLVPTPTLRNLLHLIIV